MDFDLPFGVSEETAEKIRNLAFGLYDVYEHNSDEDIIEMGKIERQRLGAEIDEEERALNLDG